uniref:Bm7852 n=1 Tax=Brugia malayi TaxID=6279 RepID=A0A1I9G7N7_BRUMA|nr:Bm7852 [Brugia malayi]
MIECFSDATVDNLKMIASAHTLFSMLANATKQRHLSSINKNLTLKYAITNNHMNNFIDNNTLHSINSTITDINSTSTIKLLVLTATTITTTPLSSSSSTTTTTTTTTITTTNITPITTTITITSNTTTTVPAATTANDDMTTTIEAVKSKFDSKTDKYDENISTAASDSISSTNSEFEMYNLATNKITPRILDVTATRRNAMYPEATSIHSMIPSSSEIFSKTKMLDKMMFTTTIATTVTTTTITTTATTIQKENIYNNDVTLNEIERLFLRFVSTWIGQSEKLIHELFDHALAHNVASIIFINEIDRLCRTRQIIEDDNVGRVKVNVCFFEKASSALY